MNNVYIAGKTAYIVAMITVISGITEKQTYIGCLETRPYREQDVLKSYGKINGSFDWGFSYVAYYNIFFQYHI